MELDQKLLREIVVYKVDFLQFDRDQNVNEMKIKIQKCFLEGGANGKWK